MIFIMIIMSWSSSSWSPWSIPSSSSSLTRWRTGLSRYSHCCHHHYQDHLHHQQPHWKGWHDCQVGGSYLYNFMPWKLNSPNVGWWNLGPLWGLQFFLGQGIFFRVQFENKISWTFAIQNTFVFEIFQVLSCPDWPTEGRVAMLKLLAFGAEQDDIVLILHMDR